MSDDEFWELTPGQFIALNDRHRKEYESFFAPFACLLAQSINLNPNVKHSSPAKPVDFMPWADHGPRKLSGDEVIGMFKALGAQVGESDNDHHEGAQGTSEADENP